MRNTRNYIDVHSVVDGPIVPSTPPAPVTHTVTLTPGEGYTAAFVAGSSSPALAGSSVYFTIIPAEGYEITSVTDGTNTLTPVNGVYTISEIDADTVIEVVATPVTPPDPVTYTVTWEDGEGYAAAFVAGSSSPAVAGSDVNFTVVAEDGYEIIIVTVNGGGELTPVNGVYTINAIAVNTTIKVEATLIPTPVTYTVTLPNGDGKGYATAFVAGSSSPAVAGSTVNFTVAATQGYEITKVDDGSHTLTPVNGVYTISEIDADTVIEVVATPVTPPDPVTYTVTWEDGEGYAAAFVAGSSSPAVAGSIVNFTVVPTDGYEITSVTDGTNTLNPVNGVYTINGIAADTTIVVVATLIGG